MTTEAERLADALIDLADYPMSDVSPQFGRNLRDAAALLRTQAAALSEREGWVLVPKEPTNTMLVAAMRSVGPGWERRSYLAMLAAAPSPNKEQTK